MKERLTGAIILVALIVLLVPELLTGPPQVTPAGAPSAGATAAVASAGTAAVHTYTLPLSASAGARAAALPAVAPPPTHKSAAAPARADTAPTAAAPRPAETSPAQTAKAAAVPVRPHPAAPRPQPRPRAQAKPVPQARPVARQAAARPPAGPRWAVQLGVFAFHADALRLAQRVRARGIPVRITPLHIRGRLLWRVASGSVRGRPAALALARRLSGLGFKGELLRQ